MAYSGGTGLPTSKPAQRPVESISRAYAPAPVEHLVHTMVPVPPVENVTHTMVPTPVAHPAGPAQAAPGTQAIDPRDATYYQNVAANQFKVNNQVNAAQLQEAQTRTSLQEALAQLAYQQPRSQLALEQRANAQGGLYSSGYGQRQGDLLHTFTNRQTAAQTTANNAVNRLTAQIAAEQAGVPIYDQGQYLAAALRAAAAAAANPATGQPPAGSGSTTAKPSASKPPPGGARVFQAPGAGVLPNTSRNVTTPTGMRLRVSSNAQGKIHFTPLKNGR